MQKKIAHMNELVNVMWRERCAAADPHAITMNAEHVNVSGGGDVAAAAAHRAH